MSDMKGVIFRGAGAKIIPSKTTVLLTAMGPKVVSPADVFLPLIKAETCEATRQDIHKLAYETDPCCPGIWYLDSQICDELKVKALLIRKCGVLGIMALRKFEQNHEVRWWHDIGTRPCVRAIYQAAFIYSRLPGHEAEAISSANQVLELDPEDHLLAANIISQVEWLAQAGAPRF